MQIKLPFLVAALAVATTARPAKTDVSASAPTKASSYKSSPAKYQDGGIDFKFEGKINDEKSKDLKSSIGNAWGRSIGADNSNNSDKDKSGKSDPNSKTDNKREFALDKAGRDDKPSRSNTKFEASNKLTDAISGSYSSTKSDKKPEDNKFIQKIENGWNSLTGNDKSSKSGSSNKSGDNLDAAFAKADKVAEKAANKLDKKDKKDD